MSRGRDINKSATEPKEKREQGIYSWYFQVLLAHYIRNFGMESPLKLFVFKLPYQLKKGPFLGPEIFAWGGVTIDNFKGTYRAVESLEDPENV